MAFQDEYKVIERFAGEGTVTGEGISQSIPVRYELSIRESLKGEHIQQMTGLVWSTEDPFMAARLLSRELELHMADGRVWDFRFLFRNGEVADRGKSVGTTLHAV